MTIDYHEADPEYDTPDSLGVYLDDGTEVGRYCIVDDPERERAELERMIQACLRETEIKDWRDMVRAAVDSRARASDDACVDCGKPVGNPVFTVCDGCWPLPRGSKR